MPAHTQTDAVLSLTLAGVEYACQVIDGSLVFPGPGDPAITPVACGDGPVLEPGEPTKGTITGTVFKDTTATGITRALATARQSGAVLDYVWTENAGTADELKVTGKATVSAAQSDFAPDKLGRHPLALAVGTAVIAAPFAAAVAEPQE